MIPVENISSATVGNMMYYASIVGVLLFVATIIRLKAGFLILFAVLRLFFWNKNARPEQR